MTPFEITAAFVCLVAVVGWLNTRFLDLPTEIAMILAGAGAAGVLMACGSVRALPQALNAVRGVDFSQTVLGYLLAFLLFAGSMQVDLTELRRRHLSVWSLATLGVLGSTFLVGGGLWAFASVVGVALPLAWALVFGALISPTDPIAVLAVVRRGGLSKLLQAVLQGEALFNDGVGIVVFAATLTLAGGRDANPLHAVLSVVIEAGGGLALGLVMGFAAVRAMRTIDDYAVEVSITIALAMAAYALAQALNLSGAIAVVAAGLIVGDGSTAAIMSETTRRYVRAFWTLIDENLNALLFLLLGLQLAIVSLNARHAGLWVAAIVLVCGVRLAIVWPWGWYFRRRLDERGATLILAWGGLHGALSLALALSLPASPYRALLLSTTFAVVIMSVIGQGLTFPWLVRRVTGSDLAD